MSRPVRLFALCLLLSAFCLLPSACAPAVVYLTPPPIGPAELQHLNDSATNTAAAVTATAAADARRAAAATATDQASRATATTARQTTLDALAAQQTESALSLTQSAGMAAATDAAAAHTQAAGQTATWAAPTRTALAGAAVATSATVRTQSALSASAQGLQQSQAADVAEFWKTIRWIVVAVVGVVGVVACVLLWIWGSTHIRIEAMRQTAAMAQSAFRLLSPGHWAEYEPGQGYQVYELPGLLNAPAAVIENKPIDRQHHWKVAVLQAIMYAATYGWTFDALGPNGANVMDRPDWDAITDHLRDCQIIIKRDRARTRWGDDVTPESARLAVRRGLPLPYPEKDAPEVHSPRCTEAQIAQLAQKHSVRERA